MPAISRKILTDKVIARAEEIDGITVYRRKVGKTPPTKGPNDLRVKKYIVVHPSPGAPDVAEDDLVGDDVTLDWSFQLTAAAGVEDEADDLLDEVTSLFERWSPDFGPAFTVGRCRQVNDPGPAREDKDVTPSRFYSPLIYTIPIGF